MSLSSNPRRELTGHLPDGIVMEVPIDRATGYRLAMIAVEQARALAPKLSGDSARRFAPTSGDGFFGIRWLDAHVFYQEIGIRAFTMRSLAGKVVPMWINDPTGSERKKNPKARTRVTESGKVQVLIFRRAATFGERRQVTQPDGTERDVPAHYPGAPGRIFRREAAAPWTTPGRVGGRIAMGNVGVWWRHPGLGPRGFLSEGLRRSAASAGLMPGPIRFLEAGGN